MTRGEEIIKEAELCASANTQIIGDWGEHYLGFIHGAEWADAHPHWISVEDEYPPFDAKENGTWRCSKDVLIFAPFRGIFVGRYECDDMYGKTYWLFNGGSYPTVERGDGYESSNVTHWMPLPPPPHHIIDANKKVDRVIGTADHIKTALDVLNKKGGEK